MLGSSHHYKRPQGSAATSRPIDAYISGYRFVTAEGEFVTYPERMVSVIRDGEEVILAKKTFFARSGNITHSISAGRGIDLIKSGTIFFDDYFWEEGMAEWLNVRLFPEKLFSRKIGLLEELSTDGNSLATSMISVFYISGFLHLNSLVIEKSDALFGTTIKNLMNPRRGVELLIRAANAGCPLSQINLADQLRFPEPWAGGVRTCGAKEVERSG